MDYYAVVAGHFGDVWWLHLNCGNDVHSGGARRWWWDWPPRQNWIAWQNWHSRTSRRAGHHWTKGKGKCRLSVRRHIKLTDELWIVNSGKVWSDALRNMTLSISLLRVNRAFAARVDLQEKEDSKVEWDYLGHKETRDLKDNLWVSSPLTNAKFLSSHFICFLDKYLFLFLC